MSAGFEEWWKVYPRKDAKDDARKAWGQVLKIGYMPEDIIAGTKAYAILWKERGTDREYIPLPASFLRKSRWKDECIEKMYAPVTTLFTATPLPTSWNGSAAKLIGVIGEPAFRAYFGDSSFIEGPPPKIIVQTSARRDYVLNKFEQVLARKFDGIKVEVRR